VVGRVEADDQAEHGVALPGQLAELTDDRLDEPPEVRGGAREIRAWRCLANIVSAWYAGTDSAAAAAR